jgi:osmoprotectant transport system permease protein
MGNLLQTVAERKEELAKATLQHIEISLVALIIAMVIAIPLAVWATRHKKMGEVTLQITSVLQTIPSLALLGLLIPFVGIGTVPAIIALVIYALLPIFQNTYVGLSEIDPAIEEAATAFGMSKTRKLVKVEFPIAMPMIISGIRSALVLIIGTATLAALVGGGGLGDLILLGIDRNNSALTLIGAIAAAVLAIIFGAVINGLRKVKLPLIGAVVAVILVAVGGATVYQQTQEKTETITIAGKLGSEPDILINMYKELIEQRDAHVNVELKTNFGKTSFLFNALKSKQIDIYPEFTGTVLDSLVTVPEKTKAQSLTANSTYTTAKSLLANQKQMALLRPMKYQNTYALAVTEQFAKAHQLTKISDLQKIQGQMKAGFTLEFIDRADGYKGLQTTYGVHFASVQGMEPALRYKAIANGDINVMDAYSTDSELARYHLVILKDDLHFFPSYQGAPLMLQEFALAHPKVVKALNQLAGKISESEMIQMNYEVNVQKKAPADVAHAYLVKNKLVKEAK